MGIFMKRYIILILPIIIVLTAIAEEPTLVIKLKKAHKYFEEAENYYNSGQTIKGKRTEADGIAIMNALFPKNKIIELTPDCYFAQTITAMGQFTIACSKESIDPAGNYILPSMHFNFRYFTNTLEVGVKEKTSDEIIEKLQSTTNFQGKIQIIKYPYLGTFSKDPTFSFPSYTVFCRVLKAHPVADVNKSLNTSEE
jgi:hypothetical protein